MLTGSWFALFTLILSAGYHLLEDLLPGVGKYGIWLVATVGVIFMYLLPNDGGWIAVGTLIFWGFLPVVTQGVVSAKNMQKK